MSVPGTSGLATIGGLVGPIAVFWDMLIVVDERLGGERLPALAPNVDFLAVADQ